MISPTDAYQLISGVLDTGDPFTISMVNGMEYKFSNYAANKLTLAQFNPNIAVLNNGLNVAGAVYVDLTSVVGVSYGIYAQSPQQAPNASLGVPRMPSPAWHALTPDIVLARNEHSSVSDPNCCTLF